MRIAVDANSLAWGWGGIPRYIHRIVSRLAHDPALQVTLLANRDGPFARLPGTTEVVCRRRGGPIWRNEFVSGWLARERPDVFWAPESLAPWRVSVPMVVTVHDLGTLTVPSAKPVTQRLAYRTSVRHAVSAAACTIAVSHSTARELESLWSVDASRIRVVHNGVDDHFVPGDRTAALAEAAKRWRLEKPFVLAVGSIEPRKGLDTLAAAARLARERGRDWEVVLAGATGYRGESILATARAASCRVLGPVGEGDLLTLYRAASVLAAPSLHEGFGLTALEAMACGTPVVIAAGSGGLVEVSEGVAVVAEERTGEAWIAAIDEALVRRDELAAAGVDHAARFGWDGAADATKRVLIAAAR